MAKLFDLEEKNFSDQIGSQLGQVFAAPTVQEMSVIGARCYKASTAILRYAVRLLPLAVVLSLHARPDVFLQP